MACRSANDDGGKCVTIVCSMQTDGDIFDLNRTVVWVYRHAWSAIYAYFALIATGNAAAATLLQYLAPVYAGSSLLSSLEPLLAVMVSIVFLHIPFSLFQAIGSVCMIVTVLLPSPKKRATFAIGIDMWMGLTSLLFIEQVGT